MQDLPESAAGNEKLPSLPAEVILSICRHFTVETHNPAKSFNVSNDTRDNIRALRHLSLTCRIIHHEVTPALYSCIYFTGPTFDHDVPFPTDSQHPGAESLVYFLRTMVDNASLRQHVKDIACLFHLRDRCWFGEQMTTPNRNYGILSTIRDCKDIRAMYLFERAAQWIQPSSGSRLEPETAFKTAFRRPVISLSHQVFAMIVCLLPNITSITLKIGSHWSLYPQSSDNYDIETGDIIRYSRCNMTQQSPLQSLKVVQMQYEPGISADKSGSNFNRFLGLMPILRNASNLTQLRCHGPGADWTDLPDTTASLEFWGPFSNTPLCLQGGTRNLRHLTVVVIHIDCVPVALNLDLNKICELLGWNLPYLEHLKVLLSPGRCTRRIRWFETFRLGRFTRLRHFCFDTRFFSDIGWDLNSWKWHLGIWWGIQLRNIETLSLVDSEPRSNLDSILKWLQNVTHALFKDNKARLRRVEYLHMPSLAVGKHNSSLSNTSTTANELMQELALRSVQFQLSFMNA